MDPTSYYSYGIAEVQLLGPPVYTGDYTIEFTRGLAGQPVDLLTVDPSSTPGVTTAETQLDHVGDWTVNLLQNVLPGQTNTVRSMIPSTTYQIRWEAVGYDPADVTPGPPTTITTTPPEVDAMIAGAGDAGLVGQGVWSLDGSGESVQQSVTAGTTATYNIQVQNNAPISEDITLTGPAGDANWTIAYLNAQGQAVTAAVTGAGWTLAGMAPGEQRTLTLQVTPGAGVTDGDSHDVLVTAMLNDGGEQDDAVLATTTCIMPPNPVVLSIDTPVTPHEVPLSWTPDLDNDFGWYELHRATQADFSDDTFVDFAWDPTDLSFTDSGLTPNTTYYYKVVVYAWNGLSADSNIVSTQTASELASVKSNRSTLCADALDQATITTVVTGSDGMPLSNQTVTFSVDTYLPNSYMPLDPNGADSDLAASVYPLTATTDANGVATTTLTSSKQIGASAIVKASYAGSQASYGSSQAQSAAIAMEDTKGDISVDADTLPADGQSTADVYLTLNYQGRTVPGHNINFYISRVWDSNGNLVAPAADGSFPGYGSMTPGQGTTDDSGIAYATYTSGTLPGTIEFEADDTTMVANDGSNSGGGYPGGGYPGGSGGYPSGAGGYPNGAYVAASSRGSRPPRRRTKKGAGARSTIYPYVSAFFVADNAGHHTNRNASFFPPILKEVNQIWTPQASIVFLKGSVYQLNMPYDLTENIDIVAQKSNIMAEGAKLVNTKTFADVYTFFVWAIHVGTNYQAGGMDSAMGDKDCFVVDSQTTNAGVILAHEIGHRFTLPHPIELNPDGTEKPEGLQYKHRLMYPIAYGYTELTQQEVKDARANAVSEINKRKGWQR